MVVSRKNIMRSTLYSFLIATCCLVQTGRSQEKVSFRSQIAPIFQEHCVACHGPKRAEGGYRIDSFENLSKAGDSGVLAIDAANLGQSELLRRLCSQDDQERMPAESESLDGASIDLIGRWIGEGAVYDGDSPKESLWKVIPPIQYPKSEASYVHPLPVTAISFSGDGASLISSGYHELLVWSIDDGRLIRRIPNMPQRTYAIVSSPDGSIIAAAGGTPGKVGEVRMIDAASGEIRQVIARSPDVALNLAFRPGKSELAIVGADSTIRIWDWSSNTERKLLTSHADCVTAVAYSDDGSKFVTGSRDKSAKVFDAETGELLVSYPGHAAAVRGVAMLPDGKQVLSVGGDSKIHRWEIEGAKKIVEVPIGSDGFRVVRRELMAWIPSADRSIHRLDLSTNAESMTLKGAVDWIAAFAVHATQPWAVSGGMDGEIRLWNTQDGSTIRSWKNKP